METQSAAEDDMPAPIGMSELICSSALPPPAAFHNRTAVSSPLDLPLVLIAVNESLCWLENDRDSPSYLSVCSPIMFILAGAVAVILLLPSIRLQTDGGT